MLDSDPICARRRKGLDHTPVKIFLPSTLLLYASTTLYMASLAGHVSIIHRLVSQAHVGLFSDAYTYTAVEAYERDVLKQSWMMTVALAINVCLFLHPSLLAGMIKTSTQYARYPAPDRRQHCAVWRARAVYCLGPLLIALTLGTLWCTPPSCPVDHGLTDCRAASVWSQGSIRRASVHKPMQTTADAPPGRLSRRRVRRPVSRRQYMIATALIDVKVWCVTLILLGVHSLRIMTQGWRRAHREHRQLLRGHFGHDRGKSRAMGALALLVESGTIFCILLVSAVDLHTD